MIRHHLQDESRPRALSLPARAGGFTFVELLVAVGLAAALLTAAVIIYGTVSRSNKNLSTYGKVILPTGTLQALYSGSTSGNSVQAYFAPHYGSTEQAEMLRDSLYEDISHASAVYCLARTGQSSVRPTTITIASQDARQWDTAESFRLLLASTATTSATTFSSYRGAASATNLSIFILMPNTATSLQVRAIYELDFVTASSPAGTYASVRRFQGTTCTDYYDIFYPASSLTTAFSPTVAQFERVTRAVTDEGDSLNAFKKAQNRPFYLVWWPDPAAPTLESAATSNPYATSDPRYYYANMRDRTSLFMVLPMFPAL